jgi:hypothetical protein
VEKDKIFYMLLSNPIEKTEDEIIFWITAINRGADTEKCLHINSSLIDSSGQRYRLSSRIVNDRRYDSRASDECVKLSLPNSVPIRFGLAFENVPPNVTEPLTLEISLRESTVQIPNIVIP